MAAATDPASLKLSDLVHGMSPSPAPQNQSLELNSKETPGIMRRSATPEALEEAEVAAIRRRVLEFTPKFGTDSHHISPREKELIDMVRLDHLVFCSWIFLTGHICEIGLEINIPNQSHSLADTQTSRNNRRIDQPAEFHDTRSGGGEG